MQKYNDKKSKKEERGRKFATLQYVRHFFCMQQQQQQQNMLCRRRFSLS